MTQYLILLALIPIGCYHLTNLYHVEDKWLYRGLSMGAIIAPFSQGLVQFTIIPVIGQFIGFIGFILHLAHGAPGYFCMAGSGLVEPGVLMTGCELTLIHLVNGIIFTSCYGMIGFAIDRKVKPESFGRLAH